MRIGLAAAQALQEKGHEVSKCLFVPVHDNYMWNKVTAKGDTSTTVFPMESRVAMLEALIRAEGEAAQNLCRALGYELSFGSELLEESPGYWAPLMPNGYLRTVPTAGLIGHLTSKLPELQQPRARLGLVFGIDNLAGMATWNRPGSLLARADLVLLGRAMPEVKFPKNPSELLSAMASLEISCAVPVRFDGKTFFGEEVGSFRNACSTGSSALTLLPPLEQDLETLSSTRIRESTSACFAVLTAGGLEPAAAAALFAGAEDGAAVQQRLVEALGSSGLAAKRARMEVNPLQQLQHEVDKCLATLAEHGYRVPSVGALFKGVLEKASLLEQVGAAARRRGEFVGERSEDVRAA